MNARIPLGPLQTARGTDILLLLFLVTIFASAVLLANPFGDFPLNDDWSFALAAKVLATEGEFRPTDFTGMPLLTNVLWGALFCLPFGFSFESLRLSTLVLSVLGIVGMFLVMIEIRQSRWVAVVAALTLAFNPIYFALSNTFMTDVPFTVVLLFAAYFLARYLRSESVSDLLLGTLFATAAILSRQLALAVPLAFLLTIILRRKFNWRTAFFAGLPIIIALGALLGFQEWLAAVGRIPDWYYKRSEMLAQVLAHPAELAVALPRNAYVVLVYFGWFLMPVLALVGCTRFRTQRKTAAIRFILASVAIAILTVIYASSNGQLATMPLAGNIVVRSGIGPETLRDVYLPPHYNHMPALPQWFWVTVTLGGILGAALLSGAIVTDTTAIAAGTSLQKARESSTAATFFLIAGAGYLFPLLCSGFFDRYLLPALPLIAAGVLAGSTRDPKLISVFPPTIKSFSVLTLIGMAIFAVAGTHDYLAWNRARWKALNELTENQGVKPEEIEGGFEFNGLHFHARRPRAEPVWWFGYGDTTYQIAIGEVPGYSVMKEYGYDRWMPLGRGKVVVLKVSP